MKRQKEEEGTEGQGDPNQEPMKGPGRSKEHGQVCAVIFSSSGYSWVCPLSK